MGGREPECRGHHDWEIGAGKHPTSREGAPGLHGVVVIVRDDVTAEPPAHCRLDPTTIFARSWPVSIVLLHYWTASEGVGRTPCLESSSGNRPLSNLSHGNGAFVWNQMRGTLLISLAQQGCCMQAPDLHDGGF